MPRYGGGTQRRLQGWSSRTGIQMLSVDGQVVTSPNQQAASLNEKFIKQCSAFLPSSDSKTAGANSVLNFKILPPRWFSAS